MKWKRIAAPGELPGKTGCSSGTAMSSAVNFPSMPQRDDHNEQAVVDDLVDDPVIRLP
jgi:hypothetical protein